MPLELFLLQGDNELKDNLDSIWSKIALTDFKLLHLKAENPKLFARIKKRARKRRFEIQSSLKGIGSSKLLQN